jgi:hypothetical protein
MLVVGSTADRVTSFADAKALANATQGRLVSIERGDHVPETRRPVEVNLAIREFVDPAFRRDPTVHRPDGRRRALYVSSPIGLGHVRRDMAIARELRALVPELQIDWLAQHPVTRALAAEASAFTPPASIRPTSRVTLSRSPPSTPSTPSRHTGAWTRS